MALFMVHLSACHAWFCCSTHAFTWQDSPYWEITAGYAGLIKASIPITRLTSSPCLVSIDEIFLEVKPQAGAQHRGRTSQTSGAQPDATDAADPFGLGESSITDSVQYIAGSIEKILQELQLEVGN